MNKTRNGLGYLAYKDNKLYVPSRAEEGDVSKTLWRITWDVPGGATSQASSGGINVHGNEYMQLCVLCVICYVYVYMYMCIYVYV